MINYAQIESLKKAKGVRDALVLSLRQEIRMHVGESVASSRTDSFLKLHRIVTDDTIVTTSVLRDILKAL